MGREKNPLEKWPSSRIRSTEINKNLNLDKRTEHYDEYIEEHEDLNDPYNSDSNKFTNSYDILADIPDDRPLPDEFEDEEKDEDDGEEDIDNGKEDKKDEEDEYLGNRNEYENVGEYEEYGNNLDENIEMEPQLTDKDDNTSLKKESMRHNLFAPIFRESRKRYLKQKGKDPVEYSIRKEKKRVGDRKAA